MLGISYHTLNSYLRYPLSAPDRADDERDPLSRRDEEVDETVTAGT